MEQRVKLLRILFGCYPTLKVTEENIMAYLFVLEDVPTEELAATIRQVVSNPGEFVPTAGNILELWRKGKGMLPDSDGAERGWEEVQRAFIRVGHTSMPKFSDPLTEKVVRTMGWRELCLSENQMADRAHFLKIYRQYALRQADAARELPVYKRLLGANQPKEIEASDE